jgi:hypothetical protein
MRERFIVLLIDQSDQLLHLDRSKDELIPSDAEYSFLWPSYGFPYFKQT